MFYKKLALTIFIGLLIFSGCGGGDGTVVSSISTTPTSTTSTSLSTTDSTSGTWTTQSGIIVDLQESAENDSYLIFDTQVDENYLSVINTMPVLFHNHMGDPNCQPPAGTPPADFTPGAQDPNVIPQHPTPPADFTPGTQAPNEMNYIKEHLLGNAYGVTGGGKVSIKIFNPMAYTNAGQTLYLYKQNESGEITTEYTTITKPEISFPTPPADFSPGHHNGPNGTPPADFTPGSPTVTPTKQ